MGGIMKLLSKDKFVEYLLIILGTMALIKILWIVVEFLFLDSKGVEYQKPSEVKALYYRTNFASEKVQKKVEKRDVIFADTIDSIKLLAIYHSLDKTVITVSKSGKTEVLSTGDEIDGYILDGATAREALFSRDGKSYRIPLNSDSEDKSKSSIRYVTVKSDSKKEVTPDRDIVHSGGVTTLKRDFIKKYTKNMGDIWKNIGINEKVVDGNIIGFQVNFVKRGSDFARLGLRRGDIITAINSNSLDSYAKALDVYKNISSIENLTLTIKRRGEEMELEYEIK